MHLRYVVLFAIISCLGSVQAGHKPPSTTFRVHVQTAGEGLSTMEAVKIILPDTQDEILIRAIPEITEKDIVSVTPRNTGGVDIQLTHTGMVSLGVFTAQDQGRQMVVFINGAVVYAPLIDTQITNGILTLPHPLPGAIIAGLQKVAAQNYEDSRQMGSK